MVDCFIKYAVVTDEGRTDTSLVEIQARKAAASAADTHASEPFALAQQDGIHTVTSRVTGNLPGSPVDIRYRFRLGRGLIASLKIKPWTSTSN